MASSLVPLGPPSIAGFSPCQYDESNHRVTVTADDELDFIFLRRNGSSIEVRATFGSYGSCDGATVNNTDRVDFVDETLDGEANLMIKSSTRFEPGWTSENRGRSEIEFTLDMVNETETSNTYDLEVKGSPQDETIIAGTRGINVNDDDDIDIRPIGVLDFFQIDAREGDDSVFMDGRKGTGEFDTSRRGIGANGGDGNDLLVGWAGSDRMDGGFGDDRMWGKAGVDRLDGGPNNDHIIAGEQSDDITGDRGRDHIEGSAGNDRLRGNEGADHLDGDAGNDRCQGGQGPNTFEDCESQ